MRITKIKVNNFKSLVGFEIDLARFNCIVGLNGSGKSTFLQFIDFMIHLMKGDIGEWFKRREWQQHDVYHYLKHSCAVKFSIDFTDDSNRCLSWSGSYTPRYGCNNEMLIVDGFVFRITRNTKKKERYYKLVDCEGRYIYRRRIDFKYHGSIFSALDDKEVPSDFYKIREFILGMESFELLSPHFLRKRSRESADSVGIEGKGLASFLSNIGEGKRDRIADLLVEVYPQIRSLDIKKFRAGWKQLDIWEEFNGAKFKTESRHINDGMLRLIAILAQIQSDHKVLLFDEIENGINQELVAFLLKELVDAKQQIVVTTHSPLFLNYLDDTLARDCVQYFYKTPEGFTRCKKFFSLPSTSKKLGTLGPGEAIADTNLYRLNEEIEQLDRTPEKED